MPTKDIQHRRGLAWAIAKSKMQKVVENYWSSKQKAPESTGYTLRPGFSAGYSPPLPCLTSTSEYVRPHSNCVEYSVEAWDSSGGHIRIRRVLTCSTELRILQAFSTPSMLADKRNHCVPILDTFTDERDPDHTFIVIPFPHEVTADDCDTLPELDTSDDIFELGDQMLEGLTFLHEHGVSNIDCSVSCVMVPRDSAAHSGHVQCYFSQFYDANWTMPAPGLSLNTRHDEDAGLSSSVQLATQGVLENGLLKVGEYFKSLITLNTLTNVAALRVLVDDILSPGGPPDIQLVPALWRLVRSALPGYERWWPVRQNWQSWDGLSNVIETTRYVRVLCYSAFKAYI